MADALPVAEQVALKLVRSGMQRMPARVLGVVLLADQETITAGEIAERLRASAGTVSGALRTLLAMRMIERAPAPGSRREHYRFPPDGWVSMVSKQDNVIQEMVDVAEAGVAEAGEDTVAGERMAEMRDFYRHVLREMPGLIERWYESRKQREN